MPQSGVLLRPGLEGLVDRVVHGGTGRIHRLVQQEAYQGIIGRDGPRPIQDVAGTRSIGRFGLEKRQHPPIQSDSIEGIVDDKEGKMEENVSVLISLYKPNAVFLEKQLESINNQICKERITVIIHDDCPDDDNWESFARQHLSNHEVRYYKSPLNLGYVKAFEHLVTLAEGDYIAFCDQDDEWEPYRIAKGAAALRSGYGLVVCDRSIINVDGNIETKSWKAAHPNSIECNWSSGDNITVSAAFRCYAIGMATMAKTELVKQFLPFPTCTGHDKWIALCASACGPCAYINEPLVRYRRHGNNVTGLFQGITCKQDWYSERVEPSLELAQEFVRRFPNCSEGKQILYFAEARRDRNIKKILKLAKYEPTLAIFEAILPFLPNKLFKQLGKMTN